MLLRGRARFLYSRLHFRMRSTFRWIILHPDIKLTDRCSCTDISIYALLDFSLHSVLRAQPVNLHIPVRSARLPDQGVLPRRIVFT
jgi:hypothetical protein